LSDYNKEPSVRIEATTSQDSVAFLYALLGTTVLLSLAIITLARLSNHFAYFGSNGQFEFYNGRLAKIDYLNTLPVDQLPDAWIIGSSNTMPFQPSMVDTLFPVERSFNLGAYWGRVEDQWAWSNYLLKDLGSRPKLVIFGVEPWTFSDDQRGPPLYGKYRRRLLAVSELAKYLPDVSNIQRYMTYVLDSLTLQSLRIMVRMSIRHHFSHVMQAPIGVDAATAPGRVPYMAARGPFDIDGTSISLSRREGAAVVNEALSQFYREQIPRMHSPEDFYTLSPEREAVLRQSPIRLDEIVNFLPGDRMDPEDLLLFERCISMLDAHDVQIVIVMLPTHPHFYDMLIKHTRYAQHLQRLEAFLNDLKSRHESVRVVLNASHVARFGGSVNAFHDTYHMTPDNTDLVLQAAAQAWEKAP
jgi:hypothetical protein